MTVVAAPAAVALPARRRVGALSSGCSTLLSVQNTPSAHRPSGMSWTLDMSVDLRVTTWLSVQGTPFGPRRDGASWTLNGGEPVRGRQDPHVRGAA